MHGKVAAVAANSPAVQLVHSEAPGTEDVPAGHAVALTRPMSGQMKPPGQVRHAGDADAFAKVPNAHVVQAVAPVAEYFPAGQMPETALRNVVAQ